MRIQAILIAFLTCTLVGAQGNTQMSPAARAYLEEALNYMQQSALNKKSINWSALREQTLARAKDAKTTWDTYPAIAYALTQLGEKHSWLALPDNFPPDRRPAIEAEIKKILARPDPEKLSPFMPSKEIKGHIIRGAQATFAYVVVPMCVGQYAEWEKNGPEFQQFADKLHALIMELQSQKPAGWIIDLRGNGGGNMWPMLAGVGSLLGEGDLGTYVSPDGDHTAWFYKGGKAGERSAEGHEDIAAEIKQPPLAPAVLPWVAVLFDRGTGSSGEAVAISFAGRTRERSFGEHTAGFSTSNGMRQLRDGAALFLCEAIEADRTGKLYPDGLDPDEKIPAPETRPAEDQDAALLAAEEWLSKQAVGTH